MIKKAAVYTGTRNIYEDMLASAKSLIAHSDVDKVHFLIEDDTFPYEVPKDLIEVTNISDQTYFAPNSINMNSRFTYMALIRSAFSDIFPNYERILSLDCDTFCLRDVSKLWELPIDDYYFAASREPHRCVAKMLYTNVGVCLMNLEKMRESGKGEEYVDVLNRQEFTFIDQDCMNYLSQGYIYDMNSEFNANEYTVACQNPRILHFAGIKSYIWHRNEYYKKYRNASWDDVMKERKLNLEYPK